MVKLKWLFVIIAYIILLVVFVMPSGCSAPKPNLPSGPGAELLVKTITKTNWLLTFSIIGVGAGFFGFLNGNSRGLSIMASCFVVLSLVLAIAQYAAWIAGVTMLGAVGLMAFTIITRKRALKEIVQTVEHTKVKNNPENGVPIGWDGGFVENFLQSSLTTKLVKGIKKGLK